MEQLPVEVVGKILSHIAAARDVLLASATCRKWRQAFHEHLSVLSFKLSDFRGIDIDRPTGDVEIMITGTIFQTTRLQSLTIAVDEFGEFSTSVVVGWLLYVRKSLLEFSCMVDYGPEDLDVAHICRCEKLEKLTLTLNAIKYVDRKSCSFTSLRSLYLGFAEISEQDLNAFLSACPKLESLELSSLNLSEDPLVKLEVRAPNLRKFVMVALYMDKLTVESDIIEHLEFMRCSLEFFKVIRRGSLRKIRMYFTSVVHLEISDSVENLETIDIRHSMFPQSEFYLLLSKSSKLRVLRLWDLVLTEAIDLEMVAMGCPQLSCLYLFCRINEGDEQFPYCLRGSTPFQNVVSLNFGWLNTIADKLCDFIESLLERCPRLKKLAMAGSEDQVMARRNRSISRIKRRCTGLNVQFAFSEFPYRL